VLAVVTAVGLLVVAAGFDAGRRDVAWSEPAFWTGIIMVFLPAAARMTAATASRRERIGLIVLVGVGLYLVKVMQYPLGPSYHDELGQIRSTEDIERTGSLFAENPIVRAYPFYPGMQIVTESLSRLTGIGLFSAGLLVIGVARLIFSICLFHVLAAIGRSNRVGGLAAILYVGSPSFVIFDGLFAYESLALPLATLVLACLIAWRSEPVDDRGTRLAASVLVLALVATHHTTAYALAAFLLAWAVIHHAGRRFSVPKPSWGVTALLIVSAGAWLAFVSEGATSNLLGIVGDAFRSLADLVPGGSGSEKQLFTSGTGRADPLVEKLLGFGSVALLILMLPLGLLLSLRSRRKARALVLLLSLVALSYPATLVLRLTSSGTETSSRLSAYVFLGAGFVVAVPFANRWLRREGAARYLAAGAFSIYAGLNFVGGLIVGTSPTSRIPGPYLVSADPRSVGPDGIEAARWTRRALGGENRVATDLTNSLLAASYGAQEPVRGQIDGVPVPTLFFANRFRARERMIIRGEKLAYVIADRRLSTSLPVSGRYFEGIEPKRRPGAGPISAAAFRKFDHVPGVGRIYDSGDIRIYDVRPIAAADQ